jgi:hypothetical protein
MVMLRGDTLPEKDRKPVAGSFGRCGQIISNKNRSCRVSFTAGAIFLLGLMALLGLMGCGSRDMDFPTEYQAVYMDNGQIFFGKLSATNSPFPILRDVFYVQAARDRDKKETKNLLIKRGVAELHRPDFMRLNAQHIVVIEPVAPDSRVAQLIRQAKAPRPPETREAPKPPAAK